METLHLPDIEEFIVPRKTLILHLKDHSDHVTTRDAVHRKWDASNGSSVDQTQIEDPSATRAVAIHLMYLLKYYEIFPLNQSASHVIETIENSLNILLEGKDTEMIDEITMYLFQNKFGR